MKCSLASYISLIAALLMSGCASVRKVTMPDDDNLLSGAGSIMQAKTTTGNAVSVEGFEEIQLDSLLTEYNLQQAQIKDLTAETLKNDLYRYRRNELQERLINASNQRCGAYIRMLVSSKSQTQMGWTGLATLFSGAAAVVPHALTAKTLAAGSTISTGILNSYNEAYFNNLTITVISSGISKQREGILSQISGYQSRSLLDYTVNAAIADALNYHAACNIISGLEAAAKATSQADATGISTLIRKQITDQKNPLPSSELNSRPTNNDSKLEKAK